MKYIDLTQEPAIVAGIIKDTIKPGDAVELVFSCGRAGCPRDHRIRGEVVHATEVGMIVAYLTADGKRLVDTSVVVLQPDGKMFPFDAIDDAHRDPYLAMMLRISLLLDKAQREGGDEPPFKA